MVEERLINDLPLVTELLSGDSVPLMRGTSTKRAAVQAFANFITAIIVDTSPTTLDTLNELAAALGDDPNFATTMTAALAGKQPIDAMLTAIAALTSANGKFLAFSGADAPAVRDIVGAVSQSAGVPTGAIVEAGSNANGNWTRFADGTMLATKKTAASLTSNSPTGSIFRSASLATWTFPQAFIAAPFCQFSSEDGSASWATPSVPLTTSCDVRLFSSVSVGSSVPISGMAVGRWF